MSAGLGAALLAWSALAAADAACLAGLDGGQALESPGYLLAYRTRPAPIPLGQHFAVEVLVCPRGGGAAPDAVRVDAHMPEHRHGMNSRPTVRAEGAGRYRAEGLLLHMPGRWDLVFELRGPDRTDRLTRSVVVE